MKIAIVGGGIGGLTTALYLTKEGHQVTIFERSPKLGGRMAYAEGDGFRIDQGPTIVLLPDMIRSILQEAGVPDDMLELMPCDPLYRIQYEDGSTFYKYSDPVAQVDEIERVFPGEGQHFLTYMKEMEERFHQGKRAFLDQNFVRRRDFWTPRNVISLWKLKAYLNVRKDANRFFRHPRLQQAFSFQTLYIGGDPTATPALYSLIPFAEHAYGIWYVKGGYAGFIPKLERVLADRGATILCSTPVEKVLIEDGACTGVQVNGDRLRFDSVVMNGDFPSTQSLLGPDSRASVKRPAGNGMSSYAASSGCLLIYLGLNRKYEDSPVHQFLFTNQFDAMLRDVFQSRKVPKSPSIYVFNPSIMDASLAPEGKSVLYMLVPVPSGEHLNWEQEQTLADQVLNEAERRAFPGLREAIAWKQVRTPQDALAEGLYQGGSFGIAPTLGQSGVFRPQVNPYGIQNLYAVGASVHPGGGVPIVMQGAKLLAQYMRA